MNLRCMTLCSGGYPQARGFPPLLALTHFSGAEGLKKVLKVVLEDSKRREERGWKALGEGDMKHLAYEMHNLKSNARSLGFQELATLAETLELEGRNMTPETVSMQLAELLRDLEQAQGECRDFLSALGPSSIV